MANPTPSDSNLLQFCTPTSVRTYLQAINSGLYEPEKIAFSHIEAADRGSVLDIGVGAGRTVPILSPLFREYVGIDYSEALVKVARERFPGVRFEVMDARKLDFDRTFDCIVFSYNGIDYVNVEERETVLARIGQLLRPGGLFVYSTHNLNFERVPVWMNSFWVRELGGLRAIRHMLPRRLANFRRQRLGDNFAYVNDPGFGFALLTTYVDLTDETRRLGKYDLTVRALVGAKKTAPGYDTADGWVYIVARKTLPA